MANWVTSVLSSTGYFGLVFLMFAENVFPPIPSELIVPLAGYLTRAGKLTLVGVIVAGTIGSLLGAILLYYFGRKLGYKRTCEFAQRHGRWLTVSEKDVARAKRWFDRHGGMAVLMCRLVPGIRSLISIPAGISRMPLPSFIAYTTAGSAVWTAVLTALGWGLAQNYQVVDRYLDPVSWVLVGAVVLLYIVRVFRHNK
jgi:membrane protein DedA with SNARE-associated domain